MIFSLYLNISVHLIYLFECIYAKEFIIFLFSFSMKHAKCKSSYKDKCIAGQIENLAFSCNYCNRKKSDLPLNLKQLQRTNIKFKLKLIFI